MGEDVAVQLPLVPVALMYAQLRLIGPLRTYQSHVIYELLDMRRSALSDDLLQLVATLLQQRRLCRDRHDERRVQVGLRRRRNGFDGFLRMTSGAQANVQAPRGEVALGGVQRGHHADLRLAQRHLLLPQGLLVARQCRQCRQRLALLQTRLVLLGFYASAPPPPPTQLDRRQLQPTRRHERRGLPARREQLHGSGVTQHGLSVPHATLPHSLHRTQVRHAVRRRAHPRAHRQAVAQRGHGHGGGGVGGEQAAGFGVAEPEHGVVGQETQRLPQVLARGLEIVEHDAEQTQVLEQRAQRGAVGALGLCELE